VLKKLNLTQKKHTTQEQNSNNTQKASLNLKMPKPKDNLNPQSTVGTAYMCVHITVYICHIQCSTEQFWLSCLFDSCHCSDVVNSLPCAHMWWPGKRYVNKYVQIRGVIFYVRTTVYRYTQNIGRRSYCCSAVLQQPSAEKCCRWRQKDVFGCTRFSEDDTNCMNFTV